jgi:hypothetical protein
MITEEGTAVILVEQHAEIALSLTEQALLLERGAIVHRARSADLLKDHATLDPLHRVARDGRRRGEALGGAAGFLRNLSTSLRGAPSATKQSRPPGWAARLLRFAPQ